MKVNRKPRKRPLLRHIPKIRDQEYLEEILAAARCQAAKIRDSQPGAGDDDEGFNDAWYVAAARELYQKDGEIEIDDDATISRGAENGAYVQAWVWVSEPDEDDEE